MSETPQEIAARIIKKIWPGESECQLKIDCEQIVPILTDWLQSQKDDSLLASATDLLNSWARESGVVKAPGPDNIKDVINRLWATLSERLYGSQKGVSPSGTESIERALQFCAGFPDWEQEVADAETELAALRYHNAGASGDAKIRARLEEVHNLQNQYRACRDIGRHLNVAFYVDERVEYLKKKLTLEQG